MTTARTVYCCDVSTCPESNRSPLPVNWTAFWPSIAFFTSVSPLPCTTPLWLLPDSSVQLVTWPFELVTTPWSAFSQRARLVDTGGLAAAPMAFPEAPFWTSTPSPPLPSAAVPAALVPTLQLTTTLPVLPLPVITTPLPVFPETRSVLSVLFAEPLISMPMALAAAAVPLALVPTKSFVIRSPVAPPLIRMPVWPNPPTARPRIVVLLAVICRPFAFKPAPFRLMSGELV